MHPLEPMMVSRTVESRFLNQAKKKINVYTRSKEYYNFFKSRSPFSPSIKALYIPVPSALDFNLLEIRMPRIFEDFNEDKYKNAWRNSIHAALEVNRAIKGGRLIMPLTGCKRFKAIWANMRNGMQFCTRTLYLHNTKGPLAVRMPLNALTRIKALNALKAKGIALSSLQVELLTASQAVHIRWHNLL